jgi:tetratricopeptide (TPR) repeat protein
LREGSATQDDLNIEGFREVSGIETTITREDAEFLEQMLKFYEAFNELNGDNQELIAESAKAFRRVGNIYRLIGEMESAAGAYEKSVLRYQLMLDEHPESRDHLLNLVRTQNELSVACRKNGRSLKAHDWNLQSQELLENSRYSSSDPEVRLELARTLTAMGFNLSRISTMDIVAAKRGVRAKPGTRSGASHATRDRVPFQPFKAQPYWRDFFRFGRAEMNRRNRQLIERAIRILDDLIREEPGNAEYLSVRATCYSVLAATRIAANRSSGLEMRDRAIAAFESLVEENPDNPEYRYLLALACTIGTTPPQREDGDLIRQALAITEALTDQFPTMLDYHHLHASLRIKVAGSLARQNQIDEAKSCLDDAASSVGVLLDLTPSDRSFLGTVRMLLEGYQRLGKLYEDAGMRQQANEVAQRGRQLRNQLRSQVWPTLQ